MVYGFWVKSESNDRVCLGLPSQYNEWVKQYNYPTGKTRIHTLDEKIFDVKVMQIAGRWFFFNGWKHVIKTLNYPSDCNFVFEYEEIINCFRMITFHQDAVAAPGKIFYCKLDDPLTDERRLHISCFVFHGLHNRAVPADSILCSSFPEHAFQIKLENDCGALYITKGWPYMKKTFQIISDHLIVFELYNEKSYEVSFFKKNKLTLPPELWEYNYKVEDDENKDEEIVFVSDNDTEEMSVGDDMEEEVDESDDDEEEEAVDDVGVPVVFTVDRHFRMKVDWAKDNGLNRKRALTIKDCDGCTWGVSVGIEGSRRSYRCNIRGMSVFAADKELQSGDQMHFLFFNKQGLFQLTKVVRVDGN